MFKNIADYIEAPRFQTSTKQQQFSSGVLFAQMIDRWPQVIGAHLAKYCLPLKLQRGALVIAVKHPVYAQELGLMQDALIQKIQQNYREIGVIKFLKFIHHPQLVDQLQNQAEQVEQVKIQKKIKRLHRHSPQYQNLLQQLRAEHGSFFDAETEELLISLYYQAG